MKKSIHKMNQIRKQKMLRRCKPKRCDQGGPQLSAGSLSFELGQRTNAIAAGGVPLIHQMCESLGLKESIDSRVHVLKQHNPYYESDHVLNIAFNILAGGSRIEHIEHRRCDTTYLDALGTHSIPDPTTAGDFCLRFTNQFEIDCLQEALNRVRLAVWSRQDADFFKQAIIEADGTICETEGECKKGMDISYNGKWGYHPLVVSLANTAEPLYLLNRSANRPSHEGAAGYFDKAAKLCRKAGFKRIHFRGDSDFTQTRYLDGWSKDKVTFTFGMDARENVVALAESLASSAWSDFERPQKPTRSGAPRSKPTNVKEEVIDRRGYKHIRLTREDVSEVVLDARKRCDQENLNAHLKNGVHALTMPPNSLHANWAYAVMAALAWSLKA